MSIKEKKGNRAYTLTRQRRARRNNLTKRRWKAYRTFVHATNKGYRDPVQRAFKGIVGAPTQRQRDEFEYRMAMQRIDRQRPS